MCSESNGDKCDKQLLVVFQPVTPSLRQGQLRPYTADDEMAVTVTLKDANNNGVTGAAAALCQYGEDAQCHTEVE